MVAPYAASSSPTAGTLAPATLIPVTNVLERLNEEIKRRTHVVRIFLNAEACLILSEP
jgi:transposase-like protein